MNTTGMRQERYRAREITAMLQEYYWTRKNAKGTQKEHDRNTKGTLQ